jgi:alanyl-tRNA synthetase
MKGNEIRESFLAYFEERGHRRVRSSSLIPAGDPTLLFTNAGMVQFKDVFLGTEKRDYARAATAQKCVRAGGKHNDLENVGRTARHHTFFEMLGNFSFGDYFKEDAIHFAWDYLTRVAGLPRERLWATVFREDDEAAGIWERKVGLPPSRIVRLGEKDNFWSMGDTGPCGPCSEIIVDQGPAVGCGRPDCAVGCDCDRYLEVWNLVFMQFNRDAGGAMSPLPRPSIDTGMGLERLTALLEGKQNNFESDLFAPLLRFIEEASGVRYGQAPAGDVSLRVIADHLRATVFLVADGVIPSNEGRGYVLRRIMRRAGRHAWMLGVRDSLLCRGVPVLASVMGEAYPELLEQADYAVKMIRMEEERFLSTLEAGLGILADVKNRLRAEGGSMIPGETVFRLYDTYGFPLDLTEDLAREDGLILDQEGFDRLMDEQRRRARASWVGSGAEGVKAAWREAMERVPPVEFEGYGGCRGEATVMAMVAGDSLVEEAPAGTRVDVFLDRTPFYGESGGQTGDSGTLSGQGVTVAITAARKPAEGYIVHAGEVTAGHLRVGQRVTAAVDEERRAAISRNHTATHLLQAALRLVLGEHVRQAGSLVLPDRLRFDFTHSGPVTPEELERVEDLVNAAVRRNREVTTETMPHREATQSGAMAIFGEKYAETVRVVRVPDFSAELCGGIHVPRAGDIGFFKVVSEGGVAAGVRRIEAVTGQGAVDAARHEERVLRELASLLKTGRDTLPERVRKLQEEIRELSRHLEKARKTGGGFSFEALVGGARDVGGVSVLVAGVDGLDMRGIRELVDRLKERFRDLACVLTSPAEGKLLVVAGASGRAQGKVDAGKLVGTLAQMAGGKGGGRPDFGQAGAPEVDRAPDLHREALRLLEEKLRP